MWHIAMNEEVLPGFQHLPPGRCLVQWLFREPLNAVAIPKRYDPYVHCSIFAFCNRWGRCPHTPMVCLPADNRALPRLLTARTSLRCPHEAEAQDAEPVAGREVAANRNAAAEGDVVPEAAP